MMCKILLQGYTYGKMNHGPWRPRPRALLLTTLAKACFALARLFSSAASFSRKRTWSLASRTIPLACKRALSAVTSALSALSTFARAAMMVGSLWTLKVLPPPKNPPPLRVLLPPLLRTLLPRFILSLPELWFPKLDSSEDRRRLKKPRLWLGGETGSGDTERFLVNMLPLRAGSATGSGSLTGWDLKRGIMLG